MKERIKLLRTTLGLTQQEFGRRLGVSRDVVVNLECGRAALRPVLAQHICDVFQVRPEWLQNEEGPMRADDDALLTELVALYDLTAQDKQLLRLYLTLSSAQRKTVADFFELLRGTAI